LRHFFIDADAVENGCVKKTACMPLMPFSFRFGRGGSALPPFGALPRAGRARRAQVADALQARPAVLRRPGEKV
jgi:hypothetical protein